jgi:predicted GNAT superfamily acetyltransferase
MNLDRVNVLKHGHGRGDDRRLYSDHYPVVATFSAVP